MTAGALALTGLSGCLGDTEYRLSDVAVESSPDALNIGVTAPVPRATIEHPAAIELSLENATEESVRIRSYGVWPFGVLALAPTPTPTEDTWTTTLFSPAYEQSDRVDVKRGGAGMSMSGDPITRVLDPGDTVKQRYELHGEDVTRAETYFVVPNFEDHASHFATSNDWQSLDSRIRVAVEAESTLPL